MKSTKQQKYMPYYWGVLPATLRYDKKVTMFAKFIYLELTALTNQYGYCWASNEYFSKAFDVSVRSIQRKLQELEKRGYIKIVMTSGKKRRIFINANPQIDHDTSVTVTNLSFDHDNPDAPLLSKENIKNTCNSKNLKKSEALKTKNLPFGDFVRLTQDEYNKLETKFGKQGAESWIAELDGSIGQNSTVNLKKWKNHYRTILNWERRQFKKTGKATYDNGEGEGENWMK